MIPKFNYARDKGAVEEATKRKDAATQVVADLTKAVDEAKQKLDDLQEDARKAGAPSSVSEQ